jgi:hypothetical protein
MTDREIADAIADACDGRELADAEREAVRAALRGPVATSDRGERVFYVQVDTTALDNVDTAECIWSAAPGELDDETCFEREFVLLPWIAEGAVLTRLQPRYADWTSFWVRVAAPLIAWAR